MAFRGTRNRDPLVSKTVNIISGMWKGYLGIVKDTTETHARVELHTGNRTVNIPKTTLIISGTNTPVRTTTSGRYGSSYGTEDGSKTPHYNAANSARTPNPYSENHGSRTPAWDAGSKTPAWDAGSKTPSRDFFGSSMPYQSAL